MLTYQKAGVDPEKNDAIVKDIKKISGISTGFSDTKEIPGTFMFMAQSTDGVGNKIRLAKDFPQLYSTIGRDLVAMCVNDIICAGADPAYFQDYIGMNSLDFGIIQTIITSIKEACDEGDVLLTGGEMAEMPGTYTHDVPELVGFATGFGTNTRKVDIRNVSKDDLIIGLPSSGPHSNGYSLILKALESVDHFDMIDELLVPTTLYYDVARMYKLNPGWVNAMAHITGGGLVSNLDRVIPKGLNAFIDYQVWKAPEIFREIQQAGQVVEMSMWHTFNMGVGMCLIIPPMYKNEVLNELDGSFLMGEIQAY